MPTKCRQLLRTASTSRRTIHLLSNFSRELVYTRGTLSSPAGLCFPPRDTVSPLGGHLVEIWRVCEVGRSRSLALFSVRTSHDVQPILRLAGCVSCEILDAYRYFRGVLLIIGVLNTTATEQHPFL